jgi:hypothetical protein
VLVATRARHRPPGTLYQAAIQQEDDRHAGRLQVISQMQAQLRLLDQDPLPFAWRAEHLALPPMEKVKAARQALYDMAGELRWDRANKCIHIDGGDYFGAMTRLRSRLLEHGYKEAERKGSGILVQVLLKKGRVNLSFSIDEKQYEPQARAPQRSGDLSPAQSSA